MQVKQRKENEIQEKQLLKSYLGEFYKHRNRKQQLEERLKNLTYEINTPIGGVNYKQTPRSSIYDISDSSSSIIFKMSEIEERILKQKEEVMKSILNIMDVLDYLEEASVERAILECRYLDCMDWNRIAKKMNLSRSSCNSHWNAGIERLLKFKRIQKIVQDYKEQIISKDI